MSMVDQYTEWVVRISLSNEVHCSGPPLRVVVVAVRMVSHPCEVVEEGIKPYIRDVFAIERKFDPPGQSRFGPRNTQVL